VDRNRVWLWGHLENVDLGRSSSPAIAKDGLVVAIDESQMWCRGVSCEQKRSLVVGLVDVSTLAETSLVPTGE